jgi:hypothetical protein
MSIAAEDMPELVWRAMANADLERLGDDERTAYYTAVCESLGLNPLTRPLEYITLSGKLTLYAKRDATDQLRHKHHVSIEIIDRATQEDVYIVRARATMPDGRSDESLGAVSLVGLEGDALANALMKAETKAKRRVALSICGLGLLDETEVETIAPGGTARSGPRDDAGGTDAAPTATAIFRAWDASEPTSRDELYAHVKHTFGKRVVGLTAAEARQVLAWMAERDEADADVDAGEAGHAA